MAEIILQIAVVLIFFSIVFGVLRLIIGRTAIDRVVAIDMLTVVTIVADRALCPYIRALRLYRRCSRLRSAELSGGACHCPLSGKGAVSGMLELLILLVCGSILVSGSAGRRASSNLMAAMVSAGLASLFAAASYVLLAAPDVAMAGGCHRVGPCNADLPLCDTQDQRRRTCR